VTPPPPEPAPGEGPQPHGIPKVHYWRDWVRASLGTLAAAVAVWVWLTNAPVLLAGHPAYPILVTLVGVVGLALIALAATARHRTVLRSRRRWLTLAGPRSGRSCSSASWP
jgi:hypothetical protein